MSDPLMALALVGACVVILVGLFWPTHGLLPRFKRGKAFAQRVLQEDALKHLQNSEQDGLIPTLESIAGALQISTNEVTRLLFVLKSIKLVKQVGERYQLTAAGRDYALRIIRAHRLWERYLADHTGFRELDWHRQAEQMEHRMSPSELEALSARLGHPTHDPHGDPIPTAEGQMILHDGRSLASALVDQPLRIVHIEDQPEVIYAQLLAAGLHPGMLVRVVEATEQTIHFWADDRECFLAPIVAANVSVSVDLSADALQAELAATCRLTDISIGEQARVVKLSNGLRGFERRRLMDLGLLPGTIILAELSSPGGDPIAYRVRGTLLALRREQAEQIHIECPS